MVCYKYLILLMTLLGACYSTMYAQDATPIIENCSTTQENQGFRVETVPFRQPGQNNFFDNGTWVLTDGYGGSCVKTCIITPPTICPDDNDPCGNGTGVYLIPVRITIYADDDGSNQALPYADIRGNLDDMNTYYCCHNIPIQYYEVAGSPVIENNSDMNAYNSSNPDSDSVLSVDDDSVLDIFVSKTVSGSCGFAYLPGSISSPSTIMMNSGCVANANLAAQADPCDPNNLVLTTLFHEAGHFLGLYHTHGGYSPGPNPNYPGNGGNNTATNNYNGTLSPELVDGSNGCTTGDYIQDTNADLGISYMTNSQGTASGTPAAVPNPAGGCTTRTNCSLNTTCTDANGATYAPPTTNIMSYNNANINGMHCRNIFSDCQKAKMVHALLCTKTNFCDLDLSRYFTNIADATQYICIGDPIPTFTLDKRACIVWYDAATAGTQIGTGSPFTPPAASVDVNIAGSYNVWFQDQNEYADCRKMVTVIVQSDPGDGDPTKQTIFYDPDPTVQTQQLPLTATGTNIVAGCEVVGWWITKSAAISAADQITLDAAVSGATVLAAGDNDGSNIDMTNPNIIFNGSDVSNLSIRCDNMDANASYYATPFVAAFKPVIASSSCTMNYTDGATSVGGSGGRRVRINDNTLCALPGPPNPPTFTITITVSNFTGTAGNLRLRVRMFDNCDFTGQIAQTVAGDGTYVFTEANFPAGFDPNTDGMCFLIYESGNNNASTATLAVQLDITYPGDPGIAFPTPTYTNCIFGNPIEFCCDIAALCVAPKIFLQGPYNGTDMNDDLRDQNLIVLNEPYTALGYTIGNAGVALTADLSITGNDAIIDWVIVQLRDENNSSNIVASLAGLVQRDGDVVGVDGVLPLKFIGQSPGKYFVSVNHRNHLGMMTNTAIDLTN